MKIILSLLILILLLLNLGGVVMATNDIYSIEYNNRNRIGNLGLLTYLGWNDSIKVDGTDIELNGQIGASNLDIDILVEGKNNCQDLIYKGVYDGTLVEGVNVVLVEVKKVNTNPNIWSPGEESYTWKYTFTVINNTVIESPEPVETPEQPVETPEQPVETPEQPVETPEPVEPTETPITSPEPSELATEPTETPMTSPEPSETKNEEPIIINKAGINILPETGEKENKFFSIFGLLLISLGIGLKLKQI